MTTPRATIESLSPRQLEILALVAKGLTNDDVAGVLGITRATARTHVAAILARLEVANRTEATCVYVEWASCERQIATLVARPAIVVMPLRALDSDPATQTFGAGFGHDLAALFSRWCWFPVIAHSSSLNARQLGSDSPAIGRALGARFLVEGSVRRGPDRLRIVIQVDDVNDGACLWSDRFEMPLDAIFDVQDAVCAAVVAACYPVMVAHAGGARATRNDPAGWELAHEGMYLQSQRDRAATARAQATFARAIERDETLVLAHFGRGLCAYDEVLNQWSDAGASERLAAAAARCTTLAPHGAEGHYLAARYHQTRGDHALAAKVLETAIANNPSFAVAHALLAQALHLSGRSDEALARMRHALRLGPRAFVAGLATLHFARGEYAEALEAAEGAIASTPRYTFARALAAAAAYWLGDHTCANAHVTSLRRDYPSFETAHFRRTFGPDVEAVAGIDQALKALTR